MEIHYPLCESNHGLEYQRKEIVRGEHVFVKHLAQSVRLFAVIV